jgi:hypothetical protein
MDHNSSQLDRVGKRYSALLDEYLTADPISSFQNEKNESLLEDNTDQAEEKVVHNFLSTECPCGQHCQKLFSEEELITSRAQFSSLSLSEKNCYILAQLRIFSKHSDDAFSARSTTTRQRQKFEYRINIDRPVCRTAFIFYHGETLDRLRRLQQCLIAAPISPPLHGNTGRQPASTYSLEDKELAKIFIASFSEEQGLPDPGRDVRKGKGRLRILLPSVLNYTGIHRLYEASISSIGKKAIPYRTFLEIWKNELPHIEFNNPKTDLCMTCEEFKKKLNQITAPCQEEKESKEASLYKEALDHLNHVKKERIYYKAHSKESAIDYIKMRNTIADNVVVKANSQNIIMSYSWDFAQQLQYPFEDQQVGPIFFKTPRRAQLFGVSCEGSGNQINYLIDEADFLEKNANTVISLLDHFFSNYALGEMSAYLTADNCVGQNKNNALIQYLMYRVLSGLHTNIEMSFLIVGHTKFSPDSHFGLIKQRYRSSQIYTYDQLVKTVEESAHAGYNCCHRVPQKANQKEVVYRNWSEWLSSYFNQIKGITGYHHFIIKDENNDSIILKERVDSVGKSFKILKKEVDFKSTRRYPPTCLSPLGLSLERQWYLYEQIRMHIPNVIDQETTCPKPTFPKPKTSKKEA